jgi:hypothetical protein
MAWPKLPTPGKIIIFEDKISAGVVMSLISYPKDLMAFLEQ